MQYEDVSSQFRSNLDAMAPSARSAVENSVRTAILSTTARQIVTLRTASGQVLAPAANVEYVKALWCFMRGTPYQDGDVESVINDTIMAAVQSALSGVLLSEKAFATMVASPQLPELARVIGPAARELTAEDVAWLRREFPAAMGLPGAETVQTKVAILAAENAALFFKSAVGVAALKVIAQLASTTAGKVLVVKLLNAAAAKAVASAAFKAMVLGFVKKAGLVMLIKAALGAAFVAGLPMHRLHRLPPLLIPAVLLGLIGAFLAHDIWKMPQRLAETLPGQIGQKIGEQWGELTELYLSALTEEANLQIR